MTVQKDNKSTKPRNPQKGLGGAPREPHSWVCKRLYDKLSAITLEKTNSLKLDNLDREAPVYRWGIGGEIKPDIAYFTSIKKSSDRNVSYTKAIFEIEVVDNHGKNHSIENIHKVFKTVKSMREAFLYNYQTKKWTRYFPTDGIEPGKEATDYSSVFNVHLGTLLSD